MRSQKTAGIFSFIIGVGIFGWWAMALLGGRMPELHTAPVEATLHLMAEFLTGLTLLAGGYGLLAGRWWAPKVHLLSLGMLSYAVLQVAGYAAQREQLAAASLFAVIFIVALVLFSKGLKITAGADPS
jgi:hypothetical protein